MVYIKPYDTTTVSKATIFAGAGCTGESHIIEADPITKTSGERYTTESTYVLDKGRVRSVLIPADSDVEFFAADGFKSDSQTYKSFDKQQCHEVDDFTQKVDEADWGMRSLVIRQMRFP